MRPDSSVVQLSRIFLFNHFLEYIQLGVELTLCAIQSGDNTRQQT